MTFSIIVCLVAFVTLVLMLRGDRLSLGMPIAYLFLLLLIHVPGAIAHVVGGHVLQDTPYTELGIWLTAIGSMAFVTGVWLACQRTVPSLMIHAAQRDRFWLFCLVAGWLVTYAFRFLRDVPSLASALEKSGAVWMLGVLLGLGAAAKRGDVKWVVIWLTALVVYPLISLLIGGFLSYGTTAVVIVLAALAVSTRSSVRVAIGLVVASLLAFNLFLSYFQHRNEIRSAVWGGAPIEDRVDASLSMFRDLTWFDPTNDRHLISLDARLNQNYFVGLAAVRLEEGEVEYLRGRSVSEGLVALVPRVLWPDKPVFGGSPRIVGDMTGLTLSETTSFGVGNVMEFHINFGIPGVIGGFLILGWALGTLDRKAAVANAAGDLGSLFLYFLPAAALIQPNGSVVELAGGAAAGWVAAVAWKFVWQRWSGRDAPSAARLPA